MPEHLRPTELVEMTTRTMHFGAELLGEVVEIHHQVECQVPAPEQHQDLEGQHAVERQRLIVISFTVGYFVKTLDSLHF